MLDFLIAPLLVFVILTGWIAVQHIARLFARRHPEFGPNREEGGGCGRGCSCSAGGNCKNPKKPVYDKFHQELEP
jgi:hypothetical protein